MGSGAGNGGGGVPIPSPALSLHLPILQPQLASFPFPHPPIAPDLQEKNVTFSARLTKMETKMYNAANGTGAPDRGRVQGACCSCSWVVLAAICCSLWSSVPASQAPPSTHHLTPSSTIFPPSCAAESLQKGAKSFANKLSLKRSSSRDRRPPSANDEAAPSGQE